MPDERVLSDQEIDEVVSETLGDQADQEDQLGFLDPEVGQAVRYVLPAGGPYVGRWRHAIVTQVNDDGSVNLNVSCATPSDLPIYPVCPQEGVLHGELPGQWGWLHEVKVTRIPS